MPTVGFSMVNIISMTPKKVGKSSNIFFFICAYFSSIYISCVVLPLNISFNSKAFKPLKTVFSTVAFWIINYPVLSFSQKTST